MNAADNLPPDRFYAQVILTVQDRAPLLAAPRLARRVAAALDACAPDAPGRLWGYAVLAQEVRLVIGPAGTDALDSFVELVKARTTDRLLDAILRADDESLNAVLRYSPVWGGALYRVWTPGYQRALFWTEYRLSNALYRLTRAPLEAGLAASAGEWPFVWVSGNDPGA